MNNSYTFSDFSKQSPKGIFIIYFAEIYRVIKLFWIFLFIIFKDFSKFSSYGAIYIYLGIGLLLSLLLLRAYLIYINFQFKIENQHFILKKGILKKTLVEIPFHRIQNINFKQNIVQQIIGVFEVSIETAGSKDTEIAIKALSLEKAEALKAAISKAKELDIEVVEKQEIEPIIKISFFSLLKVSLTENHLQNLFLFFAIVIGFFNQIQQISESFGKAEALDGYISESTSNLSASVVLVTILVILLTLIALISSFVKVFLIHFNLRAYLKDDAFEINQGLLTKKSIVLKKQKIQNVTISTNPLKRLIGISFITFKQAVSGKVNNAKKEKLIRLVGCKKYQIEIVKESIFKTLNVENNIKNNPDSYYKKRIFFWTSLFFLVLYSVTYYFISHMEVFYSLLMVTPLAVFLILKKVKKRFYQISDEMLIVGKGLLETHLVYLDIFKVQNIKMKQSIFQKRSNVADLVLQTASGKIEIPCIAYNEAVKIYNHTLYKVETSNAPWM